MTKHEKHPPHNSRTIKSKTGVPLEDLRLDRLAGGWGMMEDFSISRDTLLRQAEIAESAGRRQLAENFRRAAELVQVPDEVILRAYDALRPFRSSASDLAELANELNSRYQAPECARWLEEAMHVYARRGLLKTTPRK